MVTKKKYTQTSETDAQRRDRLLTHEHYKEDTEALREHTHSLIKMNCTSRWDQHTVAKKETQVG